MAPPPCEHEAVTRKTRQSDSVSKLNETPPCETWHAGPSRQAHAFWQVTVPIFSHVLCELLPQDNHSTVTNTNPMFLRMRHLNPDCWNQSNKQSGLIDIGLD
jgi:hypothetical protein